MLIFKVRSHKSGAFLLMLVLKEIKINLHQHFSVVTPCVIGGRQQDGLNRWRGVMFHRRLLSSCSGS